MERPEQVRQIIETLVAGLDVPVTAKCRIFPNVADTVAFARMLEEAGAACVCVHGRLREQRHHEGPADLNSVAAVKEVLRIPVVSNGNVRSGVEAEAARTLTGADCIMSAKGLLSNPRLFDFSAMVDEGRSGGSARGGGEVATGGASEGGPPSRSERAEMALEYLECCADASGSGSGALPRMISDHLLEMLAPDLAHGFNADLKKQIKDHRKTTTPQQFASLVRRVQSNCSFHAQTMSARRSKAQVEPP
jgi:tRNA-dihydrouridine synthase